MFCLCYNNTGFVVCDGKYQILHAPTYMKFLKDASAIDLSEIPLVLKNSFGFSTESVCTLSAAYKDLVHVFKFLVVLCHHFKIYVDFTFYVVSIMSSCLILLFNLLCTALNLRI